MRASIHKEIFRNCLAVGVLAVCFYLLWDIKNTPKMERNEDAGDVKMLCITTITLITGYFFASSVGSQKSGDALRNLVNPSDGTTTMTTKSPTPEGEASETKIS